MKPLSKKPTTKPTIMKPMAILLCVALLSGCSTYTPLEQLTAQALQSGDWSKVEQRERYMARRKRHAAPPSCPAGTVPLCISRGGSNICQCVSRGSTDGILTGRPW